MTLKRYPDEVKDLPKNDCLSCSTTAVPMGRPYRLLLLPMLLLLYVNNTLVDSTPLSLHHLNNEAERQAYIRGAINHLLELWEDDLMQSASPYRMETTGW